MQEIDVIILGAGAAGLFCAARAGQNGLRVLLIDHARRLAEKIRISGGGRANFTNRDLDARAPQRHFLSENPSFCRSALSRFTPEDFMALLRRHGVAFHEKHRGQMFCDGPARELIDALLAECDLAQSTGGLVTRWQGCAVDTLDFFPAENEGTGQYRVRTERGPVQAPALVIATGGLSIPKIGASDFGFRAARQFGLRVTPTRPGLVPLVLDPQDWQDEAALAGLSLPVRISTGSGKSAMAFDEDLLLTHRGISGPAVLQISSYWQPGTAVEIDLAPDIDLEHELLTAKRHSRRLLANELSVHLPTRLAEVWTAREPVWQGPISQLPDKDLRRLVHQLKHWRLVPSGTEGMRKAEVTVGGVDTRELSSRTLEASAQPGLYFIGEVVDVTGWLGGYNFQWAWASAAACAEALAARQNTL